MKKEFNAIIWIDGVEHRWIVANMKSAGDRDGHKPDHHNGPEHRRHFGGATALRCEQSNQDDDREWRNEFAEARAYDLESLHCRENRNRRGNHRVPEEHRSADHADNEDESCTPPKRPGCQRSERESATLSIVIGAQQDEDVFESHRYDERPDDQGEDAKHNASANYVITTTCRNRRLAERVERTSADVAVDNTDTSQRQRQKPGRRVVA